MSLIEISRSGSHKTVSFLGLKFNFLDKKALKDYMLEMQILNNKFFTYSNVKKWTAKEKVWFLSQKFYICLGYFPDFRKPKTFNEKLNWMKLNYCNPVEKIVIDKYEFKNYIKEKLGEGYTIPLIGVYDDVNDIDFKSLPNKFVIKTTTNGSLTGVQIVKDKKKLDINQTKSNFNNLMQDWNTVYNSCLSMGYKEIEPRVIIEEFLDSNKGQLYDYKFFCFHGEPKFVYVAVDHFQGQISKISLFDLNWKNLDVKYDKHKNINRPIPKPQCFDEMLRIAKILSKDFPFVRVDFYEVKEKVYVGELTFTPGGGFGKYKPFSWDYKLGEWLDLNKLNPEYVHILPEFKEKAKEFLDKRFFNE